MMKRFLARWVFTQLCVLSLSRLGELRVAIGVRADPSVRPRPSITVNALFH